MIREQPPGQAQELPRPELVADALPGSELRGKKEENGDSERSPAHKSPGDGIITALCEGEEKPITTHLQSSTSSSDPLFNLPAAVMQMRPSVKKQSWPSLLLQHLF